MKTKRISLALIIILVLFAFCSCGTWDRLVKDTKSDWNNGLERTIIVYTANGDKMTEYEGKIDIEANDSGVLKFDFNDKRYMYYNCFVEVIEK